MMNDLNTIDPSQPLAISTGDADEGQVTAEVVQADLPSPGKTRINELTICITIVAFSLQAVRGVWSSYCRTVAL